MKAILSVQVALGFLYEAAVDVIQQKADAAIKTGAYLTRLLNYTMKA